MARFHPESGVDGFTAADGTIRFYAFVWGAAFRMEASDVLDFGAGRGRFHFVNASGHGSLFRRHLQDLRNTGAKVTVCDVDPAVLDHPCAHRRVPLASDGTLPFAAETFDVIVADHTFEHIENPEQTATELLRVLKPGGYICIRTPSRWGYVALLSAMIPNRFHARILAHAQTGREEQNVFPTFYRLNTVSDLRRHFPGCEVMHYHTSATPGYAFGNALAYRALSVLHRLLPGPLNTSLCAIVRKPS